MNLKEKLKKTRETLAIKKLANHNQEKILQDNKTETTNTLTNIILDDKVDEFIHWYSKNMIKGRYSDIEVYNKPRKLRNFIEKMAVWYELRYPLYEVNRMINQFSSQQINNEMFVNNSYVKSFNELSAFLSDLKYFDWNDFYNIETFINSLPREESAYLLTPEYKKHIYINPGKPSAQLYLSTTGIINKSEGVSDFTKSKISDKDLEGQHLQDVLTLFQTHNIKLPKNNDIEKTINLYEQKKYFKEQLLNCVMYRIIERGGNRIGPRRAFIFAQEFARDIAIPMKYGVDYTDPRLKDFLFEYVKAGGSQDLLCYINYFSRTSKYEQLDTITVKELIKTRYNDHTTNYPKNQTELYQRMINILATKLNQKTTQEEAKQLKLQKN